MRQRGSRTMDTIRLSNIKVLFITRSFSPGGGMETLSHSLIENYPGQKEIIALRDDNFLNYLWFFPFALIRSLLLARSVDIIHINDPVLSVIGYIIKKVSGKPVVVTIHGLDITYPNPLYQKYINLFLKRLDKHICISQYTNNLAEKIGIMNSTVVPVGINFQKYQPQLRKKKAIEIISKTLGRDFSGKTILLTVGRLVRRKGVYWFIDEVVSKLNKNIVYLVIGKGKEEGRIIKLITQKHLEERVFLAGWLPDEDVLLAYKASDIFVMPNIQDQGSVEGFGIVCLEAGANQLPVIASAIEGIPDAVKNKVNGYLVEPRNPKKFAKIINSLASNTRLRLRIGKIAKKHVRDHFNWGRITKMYQSEFQDVVRNRYAKNRLNK